MTVSHRSRLLLSLIFTLRCNLALSYSIQSGLFDFQGHPIHYEVATKEGNTQPTAATNRPTNSPVLLLNGFGVGSFHQHKLVQELMTVKSDGYPVDTVYCMDYLGQGKSWPVDCRDGCSANERGLCYSGATWVDQIIKFLETIVLSKDFLDTKVHLVGNSVGGHLAVCVAAQRPDLVESLCLLNATPVWGLNLPGWDGQLPAPELCRRIGRVAFDWIRNANTIQAYLKVAYHNDQAFDNELIQQIRSCTESPGGHAAFASIMWSSPVRLTLPSGQEAYFDECLKYIACDVLLIFGRDDPWCKPAFAKRMLQGLMQRPLRKVQRYVELTNVGHCPNHEAPVAVATVLQKWLVADRREEDTLPLVEDKHVTVQERWGETVIGERTVEDILLSLVDRLATTFV
jgi:pimeloyl-ACP methyl ester carboxylesterase